MTEITTAEFLVIVRWTMNELATHVRGRGGRYTLAFRRSIQRALAQYTKAMKYPNPLDKIQLRALEITNKLEKWARMEYLRIELPRTAGMNPSWPFARVKREVDDKWEIFMKGENY